VHDGQRSYILVHLVDKKPVSRSLLYGADHPMEVLSAGNYVSFQYEPYFLTIVL